ncbi:MAG: hypothetical protein ABEJ25_06905 [Candidatus Bipolaricaulia bacterium]
MIVISGFFIGEGLYFGLGRNYAFGLWLGLAVSLVVNFVLVSRTSDLVESTDTGDRISRRVSLLAITRYLFYGMVLAATSLTKELSFFAAAGGILLPLVLLQVKVATKSAGSGG